MSEIDWAAIERRNRSKRATNRTRAILKEGDRLQIEGCTGRLSTVRFTGWDGDWICSPTRRDVSARNVRKVNGVPRSFDDDRRWEQHLTRDQVRVLAPGATLELMSDPWDPAGPWTSCTFQVWNNDQVVLVKLADGRKIGAVLRHVRFPGAT